MEGRDPEIAFLMICKLPKSGKKGPPRARVSGGSEFSDSGVVLECEATYPKACKMQIEYRRNREANEFRVGGKPIGVNDRILFVDLTGKSPQCFPMRLEAELPTPDFGGGSASKAWLKTWKTLRSDSRVRSFLETGEIPTGDVD